MKTRVPKTLRNTLLSIFILIVLFVAAGISYVIYSEKQNSGPISTIPVSKQDAPPTQPKPTAPRANSTEFAAVEALMTPVKAGSNTSVTIKTLATSACTIVVAYNDVPSKDSGLTPKIADEFGNITWAWTVEPTAAAGTWPVKVTCAYNGRTAFVQGDLQVTK